MRACLASERQHSNRHLQPCQIQSHRSFRKGVKRRRTNANAKHSNGERLLFSRSFDLRSARPLERRSRSPHRSFFIMPNAFCTIRAYAIIYHRPGQRDCIFCCTPIALSLRASSSAAVAAAANDELDESNPSPFRPSDLPRARAYQLRARLAIMTTTNRRDPNSLSVAPFPAPRFPRARPN